MDQRGVGYLQVGRPRATVKRSSIHKDALRALFPFFLKNALDSRARRFLRKKDLFIRLRFALFIRFFAKIASDNSRKNFGKKAALPGPNGHFTTRKRVRCLRLGAFQRAWGRFALRTHLSAGRSGVERERREGYTVVALAPGFAPGDEI